MKKLITITVFCLLQFLAGCTTMTGIEQPETGNWDWVLNRAYQVLEDSEYGSDYYVARFFVENLNREGCFDTGMLFPVWTIYFQNGGPLYLRMRVHPDGDFFLEQRGGLFDRPADPLKFSYTSEDVRRWITTASYTYHQLFGKFDDVSYVIWCREWRDSDRTSVYLYDSDYEDLCLVQINSKSGAIIRVRTDWRWW